jgi:hypothetical protein
MSRRWARRVFIRLSSSDVAAHEPFLNPPFAQVSEIYWAIGVNDPRADLISIQMKCVIVQF